MQRNAVVAVLAFTLIGLLALLAWLIGQGILFAGDEVETGPAESETSSLTGQAAASDDSKTPALTNAGRQTLESPDDRKLAPEVVLVGRCLDGKTPLAGVEIKLDPVEPTPALKLYRFQHPDMKWDDEPVVVHSGEDGRFELRLHTPGVFRGWQLHITAADRVPLAWYPDDLAAGRHDLGDIQVPRGCALTGTVRDEQARPRAGVRVYLGRRDVDWDNKIIQSFQMELRSGADGTFRAPEPLMRTKWSVRVFGAQLPGEKWPEMDLTGKTTHHLQIRVRNREDVDRISGTVVDEAGRPLVPSSVHYEPEGDYDVTWWSKTETDGRFLVLRRPRDPKGKVTLKINRQGKPEHRVPDVPWNTTDLRITVPTPPQLELLVREAGTGKPVVHYGVLHLEAHTKRGFNSVGSVEHLEPHAGGRLVIRGLAQGRHRFTVVPRNPALAWSEPQEVVVGAQPPAPLVVTLPRQGERPVLVVDAAGQAVAGVKLQLLRNSTNERYPRMHAVDPLSGDSASGRHISVLERELVTDAGGRVTLRGNPNHRHALRVLPPRHLPQVLWDVIPDPRFGELRIVLDPGCTVRGRVEPAELWPRFRGAGKTSKAGFRVRTLVRDAMRRVSLLAVPDASGRFQISGLPAGVAELSMIWYHPDGKNKDPEVTTVYRWSQLPAGQPADVVIDLRQFYPVRVQGLVTCNGKPLPNARITLSVVREFERKQMAIDGWQTKTDAEGRYVGEAITGNWNAYWYPRVKGAPGLVIQAGGSMPGIQVHVGNVTMHRKTVDLDFQSGALSLTLLGSNETPVAGVQVSAKLKNGARYASLLPLTDAQGRTSLPHLAPGEHDLWMWPKSLAAHDARRKAFGSDTEKSLAARVHLGTVHIAKGGKLEKRITLPAKAGY